MNEARNNPSIVHGHEQFLGTRFVDGIIPSERIRYGRIQNMYFFDILGKTHMECFFLVAGHSVYLGRLPHEICLDVPHTMIAKIGSVSFGGTNGLGCGYISGISG